MSLRTIHIVFILCAITLSFWFFGWCVSAYRDGAPAYYLALSSASMLSGLLLCGYLFVFIKKSRGLGQK